VEYDPSKVKSPLPEARHVLHCLPGSGSCGEQGETALTRTRDGGPQRYMTRAPITGAGKAAAPAVMRNSPLANEVPVPFREHPERREASRSAAEGKRGSPSPSRSSPVGLPLGEVGRAPSPGGSPFATLKGALRRAGVRASPPAG